MTKRTLPGERPEPPALPALWTWYRVRWEFLTSVCGSVPADPEVIKAWLAAREPRVKPAGALSIEETNEEVLASIERGEGEADQDFSLLVFQRDAGACVQRAATVRAHLKDCARVISAQYMGRIKGERAFSTRVINGVYHDERQYWLPWRRPSGAIVTAPDGERDKAIHMRGPTGAPLSALKRFEYLTPPVTLAFTLKVLGRSVSETDLHHLFSYGGTHGYGGERGDGEGRYTYTLDQIDAPANAPQLRTAAAIVEKHEQILDGLEHNRVSGKVAEQMNQTLKGIVNVERVGLQYFALLLKFGRKAPVPRTPILRDLLGLPPALSPTDGETVRGLLPEK